MTKFAFLFCLPMTVLLLPGLCGCADSTESRDSSKAGQSSEQTTGDDDVKQSTSQDNSTKETPHVFQSISTSDSQNDASAGAGTGAVSPEQKLHDAMEKLRPLQVILGKWRGTTRKDFNGFKAVDTHEWIWDLKGTPALVLKSDKSPYLRGARISWNSDQSCFEMTATDAEGVERQYQGGFTEPVREIVGDDDKLHRVFRLEFTQTPESLEQNKGEAWQFAFAQQENNRYLLEVSKRRGTAKFRRHDTVSTQREGTSFALSDSDYGDKTCIISQGLGTSTVSYQGKTYWVCCSGCRAAFEEDPATWIARAEKRAAEKE